MPLMQRDYARLVTTALLQRPTPMVLLIPLLLSATCVPWVVIALPAPLSQCSAHPAPIAMRHQDHRWQAASLVLLVNIVTLLAYIRPLACVRSGIIAHSTAVLQPLNQLVV